MGGLMHPRFRPMERHMKTKLIPIALSSLFISCLVSSNTQAQSAFTGFYGQISSGYESNQLTGISGSSVEIPSSGVNVDISGPSQNFGGAPLVFGLGYYWQLNSSWLLGIGADYSALSQTSPSQQSNLTNAPGNNLIPAGVTMTANGSNSQLSQRYNLFISPGYLVDKDKLLYIKAGYSHVTGQAKRATSVTATVNGRSVTVPSTTAGTSNSTGDGGYLVGLGYKQIITGGLYGFVEANYMGYGTLRETYTSPAKSAAETAVGVTNSSVTQITGSRSLSTYQFFIGLGYAF